MRSSLVGRSTTLKGIRWPGQATLLLLALCFFCLAIVLVRTAWMCDDAYITLRTVDNLVHGFGPVYNVGERVQSYTHPLWMLVLAAGYAITREAFYTPIAISIAMTLGAAALLAWCVAPSRVAAAFGLIALIFSKAFIDYSTSGLENPLSHVLVVAFFCLYFRAERGPCAIFRLSLLTALAAVNRLDVSLILAPALGLTAVEAVRLEKGLAPKVAAMVAAGFVPLALWLGFSLLYYGFPFPNTAYAKLNTGVGQGALLAQGILYVADPIRRDPLTLLAIVAGLLAAARQRSARASAAVVGIPAYLLYVVWIGGDFMAGRFLTVPFLVSVLLLLRSGLFPVRLRSLVSLGLALLVGVSSPGCPLRADPAPGRVPDSFIGTTGIADERLFYSGTNALVVNMLRGQSVPAHPWAEAGLRDRAIGVSVQVTMSIGMYGYYAGPFVHVVDRYALVDPLLARLPISDLHPWRIGHFERDVPKGYAETLSSGQNRIAAPEIAKLYDRLHLITSGNLLDRRRLIAIWQMNIGQR